MTTEYRLVVRKWETKSYRKRDLAHARKGLADAYRDFDRQDGYWGPFREEFPNLDPVGGFRAWIETREVSPWRELEEI